MEYIRPDTIALPQLLSWGNDEWRKQAACKGADTEIFFPEKGRMAVVHASKAKACCMGCPVKLPCLKFAVENSIWVGTYGGMGATDRRGLVLENLNETTVRVSIKEGFAILKRAKDEAPVATLARLLQETEDWVRERLQDDTDYFI